MKLAEFRQDRLDLLLSITFRTGARPYVLIGHIEQFETEAIFFGRPLDHIGYIQKNGPYPLSAFIYFCALIDHQEAGPVREKNENPPREWSDGSLLDLRKLTSVRTKP